MAEPKRLCIVHADADLLQVRELVKQFRPPENRGELQVWYSDIVPVGASSIDNFVSFLFQSDVVLVWISKNLWNECDLFQHLQQQATHLPQHILIVPVVAGHFASWDADPFFKIHKANLFPNDGKPVPAGNSSLQDAWYAELAQVVSVRLGLHAIKPISHQIFWQKPAFWYWIFLTLLPIVVSVLAFWNDVFPFRDNKPTPIESLPTSKPQTILCEDFPTTFDSTQLYLLITRFEDDFNKNFDTKYFGAVLKSQIDKVKNRENLPIRICYLDTVSVGQSDEAARIRDSLRADFVIWGKLQNTYADCRAGDFCFHYQPSESLIQFVGGAAPENIDYKFIPVPAANYNDWAISVGDESFEAWIVSLYNLKIGKNNPKKYRIAKDWSLNRKAQAYEARGDIYFQFRLYSESVADYDTAIQLQPTFIRYYRRGIALSRMGKSENIKALEDFTKASELNPNDPNVYYNRAKSYMAIGHGKKCTDDLNKALSVDPNFIDVYILLGINKANRQDQHQYTHALEYFDLAIRTNPVHPSIWNAYGGRGTAKYYLRQPKEALKDLTRAIQLNPTQPYLYCNRASVFDTLGQFDKAMADFDSALKLDSNLAYAWRNRGVIRKSRGHLKEALPDLNKAITLAPNNIEFYEERANLLAFMEYYSAALQDYNKVIQSNPTMLNYLNRGAVYIQLGKYIEALADIDTVLQKEPAYPVYFRRGITLLHLKRHKEAIADLSLIIEKIDPRFSEAYYYRAQAYWHTSHYFAAIQDFLRAFRWKMLPGWWLHGVAILLIGIGVGLWKWRQRSKKKIQDASRSERRRGQKEHRKSKKKKAKKWLGSNWF